MRGLRSMAVVLPLVLATALTTPATAQAVLTNADWVSSARVLQDGAIAAYPDSPLQRINPYFANYAAMGLARAGGVYLTYAGQWLTWYQSHMDATGYVTDYALTWNGSSYTETSTGTFDSTDAYAGTFLLALNDAYLASGSRSQLKQYKTGIQKAVNAIRSTQQSDGLTWATPAYHVKFLMDNAEAYAGLRAAASLADVISDRKTKNSATAAADAMKVGVDGLWNPTAGLYYKDKFEDGSSDVTTWNQWYADSTAQVWAVAVGNWLSPANPLIDSTRAASLMSTLTVTWPEWSQPGFTVPIGDPRVIGSSDGKLGAWPMVGAALIQVGRSSEGLAGVDAIDSYEISTGRLWPFHVGLPGQIMKIRGNGS